MSSDATLLNATADDKAADASKTIMSTSIRRISIGRPVAAKPKVSSPFLINQNDLKAGHLSRKSFLNRDSPILEKIAGMSKGNGDGQSYANTAKGRGNYVFTVTEKIPVCCGQHIFFVFLLSLGRCLHHNLAILLNVIVCSQLQAQKRKSDADHNGANTKEAGNPNKKPKMSAGKPPTLRPQTEMFLGSLS